VDGKGADSAVEPVLTMLAGCLLSRWPWTNGYVVMSFMKDEAKDKKRLDGASIQTAVQSW